MTATVAATDSDVYGELVRDVKPHVIRNEAQHEKAIGIVSALLERGEGLSPEERALLDLMVLLIERFEVERYPIADASPADVLRDLLASNGLRQKDLVPDVGSKGVVSEILAGKRDITKRQAKVLSERFRVPSTLFY